MDSALIAAIVSGGVTVVGLLLNYVVSSRKATTEDRSLNLTTLIKIGEEQTKEIGRLQAKVLELESKVAELRTDLSTERVRAKSKERELMEEYATLSIEHRRLNEDYKQLTAEVERLRSV